MQKTETELIQACQTQQDLKAFEILIKQNQKMVRSVIYKFITNPDDLNDVSQEVFIKAFKSIKTYKSQSKFSTWLCRIAINSCKDKLKSKSRHQQKVVNIDEHDFMEIAETTNYTLEETVSASQEQKIVFQEIKKLPLNQRMALVLHDIEDMSYEEIAKITNCPVGTVKSRIFNARKSLKNKLKNVLSSIQIS